jgi:cytidylate kinase
MAVVTLSRQVGSFGDEIAAQVASRLGHRLIDRDQFQGLAETRDPDFRAARASSGPRTEPRFFERLFFQNPSFTSLFESITFEVASWGDVVILGRGAQVVLRDMPGVFKARVVAPLEVRVRRVMEEKGVPLEEAIDFVSR